MSALVQNVDAIGSSSSFASIAAGTATLSGTIRCDAIEEAVINAAVVLPASPDGNPLFEIQAGYLSSDSVVVWDTVPYRQFEIDYYTLTGAADATEALKLHDADGAFVVGLVGRKVDNTTDGTTANVTAFVDSGELTLDADIFESGETWLFKRLSKSYLLNCAPLSALRVKCTNKDTAAAITVWVNVALMKQR